MVNEDDISANDITLEEYGAHAIAWIEFLDIVFRWLIKINCRKVNI